MVFTRFRFSPKKIIHLVICTCTIIISGINATIYGLRSLKPRHYYLVKDTYYFTNIKRSRLLKQWRPRLTSFPLQGSSLLNTRYSWRKPIQPARSCRRRRPLCRRNIQPFFPLCQTKTAVDTGHAAADIASVRHPGGPW